MRYLILVFVLTGCSTEYERVSSSKSAKLDTLYDQLEIIRIDVVRNTEAMERLCFSIARQKYMTPDEAHDNCVGDD